MDAYLQLNFKMIHYERLIQTEGKALNIISKEASTLNEKLHSKNKNKQYNYDILEKVYQTVRKYFSSAYEKYYKFDQIDDLYFDIKSAQ